MSKVFRVALIAVVISAVAISSGHWAQRVQAQLGDICVVFDVTGPGDLSFNDMAALGASSAAEQFGFGVKLIENASTDDFLPNLRALSEGGECALIAAIGFLLGDALTTASQEFPDQAYVIIDSVVDQPNVQSVLYAMNDGSALVGALAAQINARTKSEGSAGGAGIVLGIEIPVLTEFECGYYWGVRWTDNGFNNDFDEGDIVKTTPISAPYTGVFDDPAKGQAATEALLAQGFQVIYQAAGLTGRGVITAVANAINAAGADTGPPFAIGVDADQDYLSGGGVVIASAMKRVDRGVFQAAEAVANGTFSGGITTLGLDTRGVAVSTPGDFDLFLGIGIDAGVFTEADRDPFFGRHTGLREEFAAEFDKMDELAAAIASGEVTIPLASSPDQINDCRAKFN